MVERVICFLPGVHALDALTADVLLRSCNNMDF